MIQRGQQLGLSFETSQPIRVAGKRFGQDLDRHIALQTDVPGAIDLTHAPLAKLGEDLVGPQTEAG